MVEQLIARQHKMQQCHATALFQQSVMMQQFHTAAASENEILLQGWIRIWDNRGGRHYYFNTVDHDIQYDRVNVLEIAAMEAATESSLKDESVQPDGVVSSSCYFQETRRLHP